MREKLKLAQQLLGPGLSAGSARGRGARFLVGADIEEGKQFCNSPNTSEGHTEGGASLVSSMVSFFRGLYPRASKPKTFSHALNIDTNNVSNIGVGGAVVGVDGSLAAPASSSFSNDLSIHSCSNSMSVTDSGESCIGHVTLTYVPVVLMFAVLCFTHRLLTIFSLMTH